MMSSSYLEMREYLVATISFRPYRETSSILIGMFPCVEATRIGLMMFSRYLLMKWYNLFGQWKVSKLMHFIYDLMYGFPARSSPISYPRIASTFS